MSSHERIYVNGVPLTDHLNAVDRPTSSQPEPRRCPSGKARYATRRSAEEALRRVIDRDSTERSYLPRRVWGTCRRCGGWHLTAKEGKEWKTGKPRR